LLLALLACASDDPTWAVQHASVIPAETGLTGTQTWEFFDAGWAHSGSADAFVCARAQIVDGDVASALPGCDGCVVSYSLGLTELESDCAAPLDGDEAYGTPKAMAIGVVPDDLTDLDPYPGRSLGWYVSVDGVELAPFGFAYDEALEWGGTLGAPGWVTGQTYTLWPAYAWDLRE
jgi:hypothetical protein